MSQPPVPSRLLVEDFQDAPAYFSRLITNLNRFQEQTIAVLNKGVSFGDQVQTRLFSTTFLTTATYTSANDFAPLSFSWISSALPIRCEITKVEHSDGSLFYGSVGTPQWKYNNGAINILYIPGLEDSTKYNLTFMVN